MFVFDIKRNVEIKAILLSFNCVPIYAFDDIETAVNFMEKDLLTKPQFSFLADWLDIGREVKRLNYCIQNDIGYTYIIDGKSKYTIERISFFHYRRDPIQQICESTIQLISSGKFEQVLDK